MLCVYKLFVPFVQSPYSHSFSALFPVLCFNIKVSRPWESISHHNSNTKRVPMVQTLSTTCTRLYEPKKLTTSSLITAIRAVLMAITATRGKDTLAIPTVKCSTLTRSCRNCNKWCWNTSTAVCYISWQLSKLTAVHLITSIRTWSNPVASFRGGDALITAAPKCSIFTGSCANCNIQYWKMRLITVKMYK